MAVTKTIGLTGRDYTTLAAWASYLNGLGALADDQIGECYTDSGAIADTAAVSFAGVTKNGHTLTLRAATGQSFRDNANVQTNALTWNASNGAALTSSAAAFSSYIYNLNGMDVVSGLQFKGTATGYVGDLVYAPGCAISNSIFYRAATAAYARALYKAASVTNCLIVAGGAGLRFDDPSTLTDVTIIGRGGSSTGSGAAFNHHTSSVLKNVAVWGFSTDYVGTVSASSSNNATDKGTFGGTNVGGSGQTSITSSEWESTTSGSEDLRLASGSTKLKNNGAASGPTNDIAGATRPQGASYDIGCWELVAAGGGGSVGMSTETDTALTLAAKQIKATGTATETDTAQALAAKQIAATGVALEADVALALTPKQIKAVGVAIETDTALALSPGASNAVGTATEIDTALALTGKQIRAVGLATETDTALALPLVQAHPVGVATEADVAFALTAVQRMLTGIALETDTALALSGSSAGALSNAEMRQMYDWVHELALLHGLIAASPLSVTPTARNAGTVAQTITDASGTVTVTRT